MLCRFKKLEPFISTVDRYRHQEVTVLKPTGRDLKKCENDQSAACVNTSGREWGVQRRHFQKHMLHHLLLHFISFRKKISPRYQPRAVTSFIPSFSALRTLCFLSWKIHTFTGFNVVRTGAGVCQLTCPYFSFICGYLIVLWFLPLSSWYPSCPRISETWLDCCGRGGAGRATVKPQD